MADISNLQASKVYDKLCDPKNEDWRWCIIQCDDDKVAKVVGHGDLPWNDFLQKFSDDQISYGVYRVLAIDNKNSSVPSKRVKLVFITFMGSAVNRTKRARNLEFKSSIRSIFHAQVEIDVNGDKTLQQQEIETKLLDSAGAFKPDAFEFGTGNITTPVSKTTSGAVNTPTPTVVPETKTPKEVIASTSSSSIPVTKPTVPSSDSNSVPKAAEAAFVDTSKKEQETVPEVVSTETAAVAAVVPEKVETVIPPPKSASHGHTPTPFPTTTGIPMLNKVAPIQSTAVAGETELVTSPEVATTTTSPIMNVVTKNLPMIVEETLPSKSDEMMPNKIEEITSTTHPSANDKLPSATNTEETIDVASAVFGNKKQGIQVSPTFHLQETTPAPATSSNTSTGQ